MDDLAQYEEDLAAYRARRLRLRNLANRILEEMESLPAPQTFLEAERASKAIIANDRAMKQLYTPPKPEKTESETSRPAPSRVPYPSDEYERQPGETEDEQLERLRGILGRKLDHMAESYAKYGQSSLEAESEAALYAYENETLPNEEVEDESPWTEKEILSNAVFTASTQPYNAPSITDPPASYRLEHKRLTPGPGP